jgi:hypothetical protein
VLPLGLISLLRSHTDQMCALSVNPSPLARLARLLPLIVSVAFQSHPLTTFRIRLYGQNSNFCSFRHSAVWSRDQPTPNFAAFGIFGSSCLTDQVLPIFSTFFSWVGVIPNFAAFGIFGSSCLTEPVFSTFSPGWGLSPSPSPDASNACLLYFKDTRTKIACIFLRGGGYPPPPWTACLSAGSHIQSH